MKQINKYILVAGLALCTNFVFANSHSLSPRPAITKDTIPETDTAEGNVFDKVEIEASFPGGDNAWRKYLEKNLDGSVPARRQAPAGTYTVVIQFVVDKTGTVSQIEALTNHGYGMEEEVIRLLKKAPRWKSAIQDGRLVKAYRKQPVTFMVIEEKRKNRKGKEG